MKKAEQKRFDRLYRQHVRALKLQGKSDKTIDVYARAIRRIAKRFDRVPDKLTTRQLTTYFSELVDSHSWSTVKVDRCGIQFFWEHVLKKEWQWVDIVKAPTVKTIPDILSVTEVYRLLQTARRLRYRTFILCTYAMGLRLAETLNLQLTDIDSANHRVHIRRGKGHKDRFVPVTDEVLHQMRLLWASHRHPQFLFPSPQNKPSIQQATKPMSHGTTQKAFKEIVQQCGIKKKSPSIHCDTVTPPTCSKEGWGCADFRTSSGTPAQKPPRCTPTSPAWSNRTTRALLASCWTICFRASDHDCAGRYPKTAPQPFPHALPVTTTPGSSPCTTGTH